MVFFLTLIIGTATAYDFKCPAQAEWRLRANVSCSLKHKYVCLFNLLEQKYQENCLGSDLSNIGSKLVFQPLFNLANCSAGRFQPIVFNTNGYSECIFLKSKCDEEGQVVYNNGSFSNNTACRCDYTKGYAFVSKPKNSCLCIPSEEDCSCFRAKCPKLSPDYQCITNGGLIAKTKCQEIHLHMSHSRPNQTDQYIQSQVKGYSNAHLVGIFMLLFLTVFIVITVLTVIAFEYKKRQIEKLKRNADELHKIHEQILQGECGKLHFARLVFIGKNGVGKTSLMRRLLWHNKEDVKSTISTDGIEVETCNINIKDGKWSPFDKIDNDLTRLIRQVYTEKTSNVERSAGENVDDQGKFSSNTDELNSVLDRGLFASSADSKSSKTDDIREVDISQTHINPFTSEIIDNSETKETDSNEIQPENIEINNVYDNKNNINENESNTINDESINQLTSRIMKSYVKRREREQDDMLAFCWLWDFAGQKDFYATHQVFLSKCAVYLLVTDSLEFSIAEKPGIGFEDSAQYVSFWFDAIHCYQSTTEKNRLDPPIIVVCTNEDKIKEPSERQKRQRKFKDNLGQVLKNQKKKGHLRNVYFVSNTDDDDIVFEEIRKEISRQAMDMQD